MSARADVIAASDGAPWTSLALAKIEAVLGAILVVLLASLLAIVSAAVVARYVFNSSFAWTEELAQWLFASMIFLGLPLGSSLLDVMRVEVLVNRLRGAWRQAADHAADVIGLFGLVGLLTGASAVVNAIGGHTPVLGLPEQARFAIVAGGAFLALAVYLLRAHLAGKWVSLRLLFIVAVTVLQIAINQGWLVPAVVWSGSAVASIAIAVALVLGVPVPMAFLFGVLLAVFSGSTLPAGAVVQNLVGGASRFLLLAIPFFLLTGTLISAGKLSHRIVRLSDSLVGHRRAGLAQTTLVTNSLFSCVSGSSVADAALGSKILVPQLVAKNYPAPYAAALVASTAVLDNIIPPSVAFLILAAATNLSVGDLWLSGVGGGLILAAAMAITIHWIANHGVPRHPARLTPGRSAARPCGARCPSWAWQC